MSLALCVEPALDEGVTVVDQSLFGTFESAIIGREPEAVPCEHVFAVVPVQVNGGSLVFDADEALDADILAVKGIRHRDQLDE